MTLPNYRTLRLAFLVICHLVLLGGRQRVQAASDISPKSQAFAAAVADARNGNIAQAIGRLKPTSRRQDTHAEIESAYAIALALANEPDPVISRNVANFALQKIAVNWEKSSASDRLQLARMASDIAEHVFHDRREAEGWAAEILGVDPDNKVALAVIARFERLRQLDDRRVQENAQARLQVARQQALATPRLSHPIPIAPIGNPMSTTTGNRPSASSHE